MIALEAKIMTKLLEKAFSKASKLSEDEQDALAQWLLREIEAERRWMEAFESSQDVLSDLADEALKEHRDGRTEELAPQKL